jgi:hypothetical protein
MEKDIESVQETTLKDILKRHQNTTFGKRHNFKHIRNTIEYQRNVPLREYAQFEPFIERVKNGDSNVLSTGTLEHWIQTSGSTGNPKLVPYTTEYFKDVSFLTKRYFLSALAEASTMENPFNGKFLAIMAFPVLRYENQVPVGYISGAAAVKVQKTMGSFVIPGPEIMNLPTWDDRNREMFKACLPENITGFAGVTSYVTAFLKTMKEGIPDDVYRSLDGRTQERVRRATRSGEVDLQELWPEANLFISSGVNLGFYVDWLRDVLGDIVYREVYASSEMMTAAVQVGEERGMFPSIDMMFFEFIPKFEYDKHKLNADVRLLLPEVKKNTDYVIAMTTKGGLYSYVLGDVIRFSSTDPPRFHVAGRTKREINLSAEKMQEHHIIHAIQYAQKKTKALVNEFIMTAKTKPSPRYVIGVEFSKIPTDLHHFSGLLEEGLQRINPVYEEVRSMGALEPPIVMVFEKGSFLEYSKKCVNEGRPLGQMKPPHITMDNLILDNMSIARELEIVI